MTIEAHGLNVYVLMLKQDDPHKCTAAKLAKFGFARALVRIRQIPRESLVLNPMASRVILPNDRNQSSKCEIVAIDCSWEKAQD